MRILVIDNYDSFVYNLVQYLAQLGEHCTVWRNDAPELGSDSSALEEAVKDYEAILISPGPGNPDTAGKTLEVIAAAEKMNKPLLGVCLGHQALAQYYGASIIRADELFHGKTSPITHTGEGVLADIPSPFIVTRYHSLTVDPLSVPEELEIIAHSDSGMIMALHHKEKPLFGVQFHPESVMTEYGHRILGNWLKAAGKEVDENTLNHLEKAHAEAVAHVTEVMH